MPLTLLLGGARSGKSALAVRLAARSNAPVVFIATAQAGDEEMAARIARHREERPSHWTTVEAPTALEAAIQAADPMALVVVDCLTLWVTNLHDRPADDVLEQARGAAVAAAQRPGRTVAVSNEVGSGIVPFDPVVRVWRDLLGTVNAVWSDAAERAVLVVAGRVIPLEHGEELLGG